MEPHPRRLEQGARDGRLPLDLPGRALLGGRSRIWSTGSLDGRVAWQGVVDYHERPASGETAEPFLFM